jgi:hypothetical protein
MKRFQPVNHLRQLVSARERRLHCEEEYMRIFDPAFAAKPTKAVNYAHMLSAGMKAKKYKGGKAASIKASTRRVFDQYFKPLPTP